MKTNTNIIPEHLADLRKSGLTDETIEASGLYTARPHELKRINGWEGTGLVFPYMGCDGYSRVKMFPAKGDQKYHQKAGSPNHLYIPTQVLEAAKNKATAIYITEGEKKALAALQSGLACIGIPGLWNWSDGIKNLIPDFGLIDWNGRIVFIVPDNDWKKTDRRGNKKNLVAAVIGLAYRLIDLGARVYIVSLPAGDAKGLDDYLLTNSVDDLKVLPTEEIRILSMDAAIDQATTDDLTEILRRIASLPMESEREIYIGKLHEKLKIKRSALAKDLKAIMQKMAPDRPTELDGLTESEPCHSAVDFYGDTVILSFRITGPDGDEILTVISGPNGVDVKINEVFFEIDGNKMLLNKKTTGSYLRDTWSLEALKKFKEDPTGPEGLFPRLVAALKTYLDMADERAFSLLVAWVVGSYFAWGFSSFPFLYFDGPKETGKSKTMEAFRFSCFNAWKGRDLTTAAMGDTVEGLRGTILLDQAERLPEGMVGLLADSYKRAGGKRRVVEMSSSGRSVLEFSTYGPKAFASTKPLDPDLRDRCVRIPMVRTSRRLPDLEGWEPVWAELRDLLYRFLLTAWPKVRAGYLATEGDGTRNTELWRPLQVIMVAMAVDKEIITQTRDFFLKATESTRHELSDWETALFDVLLQRAEATANQFEMTTDEIISAMGIDSEKGPSHRWVGGVLTTFSLYQNKRRPKKGRTRQTIYTFIPEHVRNMAKKYFRDTPSNDVSHVSPDDLSSDDKELSGTYTNKGTCPHVSQDGNGTEGDTYEHVPSNGQCTTKPININEDLDEGTQGHVFPGGIQEKLFNGDIDMSDAEPV